MTLADRLQTLAQARPTAGAVTLTKADLLALAADEPVSTAGPAAVQPVSWRERLWTCPAETRLGVQELAEAVDRSRDWVYRAVDKRRAKERGREPLPCARLDGVLVFQAGAVRRWLEHSEQIVTPERRALRAL